MRRSAALLRLQAIAAFSVGYTVGGATLITLQRRAGRFADARSLGVLRHLITAVMGAALLGV